MILHKKVVYIENVHLFEKFVEIND